jgi:hypothetical protein
MLTPYRGHNVSPPPHLRKETDPVSKTYLSLILLEHRAMDRAQKLSNSEWYIPSSEPFGIHSKPIHGVHIIRKF